MERSILQIKGIAALRDGDVGADLDAVYRFRPRRSLQQYILQQVSIYYGAINIAYLFLFVRKRIKHLFLLRFRIIAVNLVHRVIDQPAVVTRQS